MQRKILKRLTGCSNRRVINSKKNACQGKLHSFHPFLYLNFIEI